jgi:uncharacterized glyoxalase superfamily protein PhnB
VSDVPTVVPALTYRDAVAALVFLEQAFGFEPVFVTRDDAGRVRHAELRHGSGMLMLSERTGAEAPPPGQDFGQADHPVYVVIDDVDAHAAHARTHGADVLREPADTPYASREYAARDPEGHLWSFGTYVPGSYAGDGEDKAGSTVG